MGDRQMGKGRTRKGWTRSIAIGGALWLGLASHAAPARAQVDDDRYSRSDPYATRNPYTADTSTWEPYLGVGFGLSPTTFLIDTGLDYHLNPNFGIGPRVQIGIGDDDLLIVAPTANVRYRFDLDSDDEFVRNLHPYLQGGLGLIYIERDRFGREFDDVEFLMNGGFGVEYAVNDRFSIGNGVLFNGMPADEALGEKFFFTWQFLTARVRF